MSALVAFLIVLAALCVACAVVSAVLMKAFLDRKGASEPLPLWRLFFFRNLTRYRDITKAETGKVGLLYYLYIILINAAWVVVVVALLVRAPGA